MDYVVSFENYYLKSLVRSINNYMTDHNYNIVTISHEFSMENNQYSAIVVFKDSGTYINN